MRQDLEQKLITDFHNLYKQHKLPMTHTCMCWGIECEDGWYELLYELSEKLTKLAPTCEATQVKEKYGTLRFYVGGEFDNHDEVFDLIDEYEDISGRTCETCGDTTTAKLRGISWYYTACDKCYNERESK